MLRLYILVPCTVVLLYSDNGRVAPKAVKQSVGSHGLYRPRKSTAFARPDIGRPRELARPAGASLFARRIRSPDRSSGRVRTLTGFFRWLP